MKEAAIQKQLAELNKAIMALPSRSAKRSFTQGIELADGTSDHASVQDTLEILALQIKYLLFDLEATRRENRYLRKMLEARPPGDGNTDDGPAS